MAKTFLTKLEFDNYHIPVKIYKEWRASVRYSLGKKNAIVRVPNVFTKTMLSFEINRLEKWLKKQINANPKIATRFLNKQYLTGDVFIVREKEFKLNIVLENRKTNTAKIDLANNINIKLSDQLSLIQRSDVTKKLIIKTLSKYFKSEITNRVHNFNDAYFHKEIQDVKLKYNQSNWGSCSTKKNINLSSRLLLAPQEVLDYVIVHELAHLIEMNHSQKFWNIVKGVMPDYKEKEKWLKNHGHALLF